jgi:hypothetical protein
MKTKGGSQYLVSANSLMGIGEGEISITNTQVFVRVRRLAFSRNIHLWGELKIMDWDG